jgi:hypothetical protein
MSTLPVNFSSHHHFDTSYLDKLCENTLPIEHDPDFVNLVGSRLELGKESDSDLTCDTTDDDINGSALVGGNQLGAASLFPGFQPSILLDDARTINPSLLQPANEEALLALVIENHLPQVMYNKILDWANFACFSNFKFPDAPVNVCKRLW